MRRKIYFTLACAGLITLNVAIAGNNQRNPTLSAVASTASVNQTEKAKLDATFSSYEVYSYDAVSLNSFAKKNPDGFNFDLNMGKYSIAAKMHLEDLLSTDLVIQVATENGVKTLPRPEPITYAGALAGQPGSDVRLNIHDGVFSGLITNNGVSFGIQPLADFEPSASKNAYVVYEVQNVILNTTNESMCDLSRLASIDKNAAEAIGKKTFSSTSSSAVCAKIKFFAAVDYSCYVNMGSTSTGVTTKLQGMLNYVNVFYSFAELKFYLTGTFIETTQLNTWGTNVSGYALWPAHKTWSATNQAGQFDISALLTSRDITGLSGNSLVGLAAYGNAPPASCVGCPPAQTAGPQGTGAAPYVSTPNGIIVIEYGTIFTTDDGNAGDVAHEAGHLFDCVHESITQCVMNPTISGINSGTWTFAKCTSSDNVVLASKASLGSKLGACVDLPTANFSANQTSGCNGSLTTNFIDNSQGLPTSWAWDFGDGGTSTLQNPSHTYNAVGNYTVKLTATNSFGNNSITKTNYITVGTGGPAVAQKVGPVDSVSGKGGFNSNAARAMMFTVSKALTFNSIRVYTGDTAGDRRFLIADTAFMRSLTGTIYKDTTINLPAKQDMRVNFNVKLPPGSYALMLASASPTYKQNLWRSNSGSFVYPMSIANVISIYNNAFAYFGKSTPSQWYVGYDWQITVDGCASVGISDIDKGDNRLSIYPNPSNGIFNLNYTGVKSTYAGVEIYNVLGVKIISNNVLLSNGKKESVDLSNQANGIYFLRITGDDGYQLTRQIIKD